MSSKLKGTVAIVTGASSGSERQPLAAWRSSARVALVARRADRIASLAAEIEKAGGVALAVETDITSRAQARQAAQTVVDRFGRLDILVNNAGLMLLGPVVGADVDEWERILGVNVHGSLYMTAAALPHLFEAAKDPLRRVADIVNVSSVAGRVARSNFGVYNLTKFGINGFTESLRQEVTKRHVRVGVLEPGEVTTELVSHNNEAVKHGLSLNKNDAPLAADDIADGIAFMVTRPRHTAVGELWIMPTTEA